MQALPLAGASMSLAALAVIPAKDFAPRAVEKPSVVSVSGPSPAVAVGDFVFISGQLATADPGAALRDGLPEEACVPSTAFWGGQPIRVETEYVLRKRVLPALERAGSSFKNVVKAQVYLSHFDDLHVFRQVWAECFFEAMPATTIIVAPKRSMGLAAARVEINIVALRDEGTTRKEIIRCEVTPVFAGFPAAVKAGDLLFLSGLMANDAGGVAPAVNSAQAQADVYSGQGRDDLRGGRHLARARRARAAISYRSRGIARRPRCLAAETGRAGAAVLGDRRAGSAADPRLQHADGFLALRAPT